MWAQWDGGGRVTYFTGKKSPQLKNQSLQTQPMMISESPSSELVMVADRWPNLLKPPTEAVALFLIMNQAVRLPLLTNMSGREDR